MPRESRQRGHGSMWSDISPFTTHATRKSSFPPLQGPHHTCSWQAPAAVPTWRPACLLSLPSRCVLGWLCPPCFLAALYKGPLVCCAPSVSFSWCDGFPVQSSMSPTNPAVFLPPSLTGISCPLLKGSPSSTLSSSIFPYTKMPALVFVAPRPDPPAMLSTLKDALCVLCLLCPSLCVPVPVASSPPGRRNASVSVTQTVHQTYPLFRCGSGK